MKRQRLLLLLVGALSVTAFAPFHLFPLGILSLAVLAYACWQTTDAKRAALLGFAWGLGFFLAGVSWIYVSMHVVGGMPAPIAALMTLLFCVYLALYPALASAIAVALRRKTAFDVAVFGAAWVFAEWLRGTVATGFPWLAAGYAHAPPSPLAGYAALLGVYGVGFVAVSIAAGLAWMLLERKRQGRWPWPMAASLAGLVIVGVALRGVHWTEPVGAPTQVSLLQGNVPQSLKWDPERLALSLETYARLSKEHPAPLVVLPETAIPLMFNEVPRDYLKSLTANGHVLLGAAVTVRDKGRPDGYANGAILLTPELTGEAYFKRHLVPFGEFVPPGFRWFLDLMRIPLSDFTSGPAEQKALIMDEQRLALNICYEDLFGEELIVDVPDATLLINLSNTAWFGDSLAQDQHLQIAQMRALETGRMMLRSTNTGMTAAVNPDGSVAAVLPAFTRDGLVVSAQGYRGLTPYVVTGNPPVLLLVLGLLGYAVYRKRKS